MPCRFESRGRSLGVVVPDGSEPLAEVIREALRRAGAGVDSFTGRVEGLLEFGSGRSCELAVDVENGAVTLLCIDCGSEALGDDALAELRELMGATPAGGYVELMELSEAALSLDRELAGGAAVSTPVRLGDLAPPSRARPAEGVEAAGGAVVGRSVGGVDEGSTTSAQPPEELLDTDSEVFLANVVINSKVIDVSSDGGRLGEFIAKAADLSSRFRGCVYRLAITLRDGEVINAFFYGGSPCALFRHGAGPAGVTVVREGVREFLETLPREGVKHMLLCEVRFPPVVEGIRRICRLGEGAPKSGGRRRPRAGGILSKLFRRL